jgi:hypothetical protein
MISLAIILKGLGLVFIAAIVWRIVEDGQNWWHWEQKKKRRQEARKRAAGNGT